MARAHFISKSRKDIYENGKYVKYKSKKGKHKGETLERLDVTKPENSKDKILIKKGESYYWWQFKGGNKIYSKTAPKRSSLTRSGFLSSLYDIQDRMSDIRGNVSEAEELESLVEEIKDDLQSLKEETDDALERMPEQLQESSSSGELLLERSEALDEAINELECLDLGYEEPDESELRTDAIEELQLDEDDEEALQDKETEINDAMQRIKEDKVSEWLDEKCEEISNIEINC